MLWYTIQSKQNIKSPRTSRTLGFKNHFRAAAFDRHLEINLYLHSGLRFCYWRASLGELLRICRFHPRSLFRTAKNSAITAFVLFLFVFVSFIASGLVFFDAYTDRWTRDTNSITACIGKHAVSCLKEQNFIADPQCQKICASVNDNALTCLPTFWWLHFPLALTLLLLLWRYLARDTKLTTIRLYFFFDNEPFPTVEDNGGHGSCTFAIRLLHPHLSTLANQYLNTDSRFVVLGHIEPLAANETQTLTLADRQWLDFRRDLAPIVRLALAFSLRMPISRRPEDTTSYSIENDISKSLRFSYKLHLPQLAGYISLITISLISTIARPFGDFQDTQYVLILATFGFFWAFWAVILHNREEQMLRRWERANTHKPFESSPINVLDYNRDYSPLWYELHESDFETGIVEYGMDKQNLLNLLLSVLLMAYFTMLQLTK